MKIKQCSILLIILFIPALLFAKNPGRYELVIPFQAPPVHSMNQVVIHEVFAFDCGHCFNFHSKIKPRIVKKFGEKVKIIPQPIGWRGHNPGRLYFIAEKYGKGEQVIMTTFDMIFNKGLGASVFQKDILQFVAQYNGLKKEFEAMMEAPEIVAKMNKSVQYAKSKNIDSTPTLIIGDGMVPEREYNNLITIINSLLKKPVD